MSSDRQVPLISAVEDLFPEDSALHQILELERDLDHKITRKQLQIADAAFKTNKMKRILKVFVSHTTENQPTALSQSRPSDPDVIPSWTLRIDARLESYGRQGRAIVRPFSSFLRSLVVQLGEGREGDSLIDWTKGPTTPETDGFEIRRAGSNNVPVRVFLRLDYQPEKYRLSPTLSKVLDLDLATKPQIVLAVWQYIKLHKLQESDEKKIVNNDETLQRLFGVNKMSFSEIPTRLEPHLLPPEPIELDYLLAVDRAEGSAIWEVDVEVDDPAKPRLTSANVVALQREIALLEQKINEVYAALKASLHHQHLLTSFAKDPVQCIRRLMDAQRADQELVLGEPALTFDDLYRAQNFETEEIERAVAAYAADQHHPSK